MTHKAISLKQPFANWVCEWKKTIETRTWNTNYRGDLVICSSQSPQIEPYGCALCIVELYDVQEMVKKHERKACCERYPNAKAWFLRNLRVFAEPIPIKGSLGIYNLELPGKIELT